MLANSTAKRSLPKALKKQLDFWAILFAHTIPLWVIMFNQSKKAIGTASAYFAKFRWIRPQVYIEDLLRYAGDNMMLTSQNQCWNNNMCDRSKTNSLNEVYVVFNKISL